jgi:hypothetical protein
LLSLFRGTAWHCHSFLVHDTFHLFNSHM